MPYPQSCTILLEIFRKDPVARIPRLTPIAVLSKTEVLVQEKSAIVSPILLFKIAESDTNAKVIPSLVSVSFMFSMVILVEFTTAR